MGRRSGGWWVGRWWEGVGWYLREESEWVGGWVVGGMARSSGWREVMEQELFSLVDSFHGRLEGE